MLKRYLSNIHTNNILVALIKWLSIWVCIEHFVTVPSWLQGLMIFYFVTTVHLDCVALLKRKQKSCKGRSFNVEKSTKAFVTLSITSVNCLAELLNTIPHFNFRNNIITVLVPNIELSRELLQVRILLMYFQYYELLFFSFLETIH